MPSKSASQQDSKSGKPGELEFNPWHLMAGSRIFTYRAIENVLWQRGIPWEN
jgi:hypothetical protein